MARSPVLVAAALAVAGASFVVMQGCVGDAPINPGTDGGDAATLPDTGQPPGPDGGDAAPPLDLAQVPGLVFWYTAKKGVTQAGDGGVLNWVDQGPNGVSAGANGLQCNSPSFAMLQGQPAVDFGGLLRACLRIPDGPQMQWSTAEISIFAVTRMAGGAPADGVIFEKGPPVIDAGAPRIAFFASGAAVTGTVGTAAPNYTVTGPIATGRHVLVLQRIGSTTSLRIDGVDQPSKVAGAIDVSLPGTDATLGGPNNQNPNTNGKVLGGAIHEILAVRGPLAPAVREQIEKYLAAQWAP